MANGFCAYCPASNPSNGWQCEGLTCPPGSGLQRSTCTACTAGTAGNGTTTFPCPRCPAGTYADTVASGSCKSCRTIAQVLDFYSRGYILAVTDDTGKRGSSSTPCNTPCPNNAASVDGVSCSSCRSVPGYGLDKDGNCVPCPPGQYATNSMSVCAACEYYASTVRLNIRLATVVYINYLVPHDTKTAVQLSICEHCKKLPVNSCTLHLPLCRVASFTILAS